MDSFSIIEALEAALSPRAAPSRALPPPPPLSSSAVPPLLCRPSGQGADMAFLGTPVDRLRALLMVTAAYALWTAISLRSAVRPSFAGSHCFEDTEAGAGGRGAVAAG